MRMPDLWPTRQQKWKGWRVLAATAMLGVVGIPAPVAAAQAIPTSAEAPPATVEPVPMPAVEAPAVSATAAPSVPPAQLYMPDGQLTSHSLRV